MPERVVGVVGGGLMGSGIAEVSARSGCETLVMEPGQQYLDAARSRLEQSLARALARQKLTESAADEIRGRVGFTTELGDLAQCDVVIEAVPEKVELKREVFAELDRICQAD